ncbi:PadR family transcriptional regulator [Nocardia brasiliensis]|uniref:PadR family transcriptional regulator n=1 Tax=Nocardia brasiliensis TaxID=37326 RepID=UPI002457A0C7|nr:PadR family transcriptional regulator [Nocardia brasiliensis]
MKLEFPLLGLVAARAMSGYDIKRWCEVEGKFVGLDRHGSQIYRELNRMQVEGSVEWRTDPRDGGPDAKIYTVTDAGMQRLLRWVRSAYVPPRRFQDPEFAFRLRVGMMLREPGMLDLVREELAARREQVRLNRNRPYDTETDDDRAEIDAEALDFIAHQIRHQGERQIDEWIAWLEQLQEVMQARADAAATERSGRSKASS